MVPGCALWVRRGRGRPRGRWEPPRRPQGVAFRESRLPEAARRCKGAGSQPAQRRRGPGSSARRFQAALQVSATPQAQGGKLRPGKACLRCQPHFQSLPAEEDEESLLEPWVLDRGAHGLGMRCFQLRTQFPPHRGKNTAMDVSHGSLSANSVRHQRRRRRDPQLGQESAPAASRTWVAGACVGARPVLTCAPVRGHQSGKISPCHPSMGPAPVSAAWGPSWGQRPPPPQAPRTFQTLPSLTSILLENQPWSASHGRPQGQAPGLPCKPTASQGLPQLIPGTLWPPISPTCTTSSEVTRCPCQ
nr:uncharacterized protein LOC111757969 [Cavia porcellus]